MDRKMKKVDDKKENRITYINCITGETEQIILENRKEKWMDMKALPDVLYTGPGLVDLQINGVNGIDFNDPYVTVEQILLATRFLLSQGVTTFFPTIITNADEVVCSILETLYEACLLHSVVNDCIGGIHLEGPFISPEEGAKGAHDKSFIKAPDWDLFEKFQAAAGGRIKIITLAPEWERTEQFIRKCAETGVIVSIGHSMANSKQIKSAVSAGAKMSTHLGNAIPLLLPRHPNLIWDQLAADELYTCLITDGLHLPDSFIKTVYKVKGDKTLLVSDATCFAGMEPGEYRTHIGGTVILDEEKRVSLKGSGGLLAGAAKTLLENVQTLIDHKLAELSGAWQMASLNVLDMLRTIDPSFIAKDDRVLFEYKQNKIFIKMVVKGDSVVINEQG